MDLVVLEQICEAAEAQARRVSVGGVLRPDGWQELLALDLLLSVAPYGACLEAADDGRVWRLSERGPWECSDGTSCEGETVAWHAPLIVRAWPAGVECE